MADQKTSIVEAPLVYCIVLSWERLAGHTCLSRISNASGLPDLVVVVVDNCSQNDTVAKIKQNYLLLRLLETMATMGFSDGNNVGIRLALKNDAD
jgi:GT2 family glycosyltransferase